MERQRFEDYVREQFNQTAAMDVLQTKAWLEGFLMGLHEATGLPDDELDDRMQFIREISRQHM